MELSLPTATTTQGVLFGGLNVWESVEIYEAVNIIIGYIAGGNTVFQNVISYKEQCFLDLHPKTLSKYRHIPLDMKIMFAVGSL
jgi:hypothetical protein